MMSDLAEYYEHQEPVTMIRFAGHLRLFAVYDITVLEDLTNDEGSLFAAACARVLRGDTRIRTLPKDGPSWHLNRQGHWRPNTEMEDSGGP